MPLPTAHAIGTDPDYGVVSTSRDGLFDHADDSECVLGDRINQMSADIKALYGVETANRSVVDKTAAYVIQAADNGKIFRDGGASGAASGRPFTMPVTPGQRHVFIAKSGNGLQVEPASGTVKYGEASGAYLALATYGAVELIGDGTDLIVLNLVGSFDGVA